MNLPQIETPTFELTLPSNGQEIEYRPFLVKEEKILYMALEGEDPKEVANAVKNVVQNCILTEGIKVEDLPSFDLEYIFLKLRCKSVGEVSTIGLKHTEGDCDHVMKVEVDLNDIEVKMPENLEMKKMITDKIGVSLRFPTLEDTTKVSSSSTSSVEQIFMLLGNCIKNVFDEETVYEEFKPEEIQDWLQTLNKSQITVLMDWFNSIPTVEKEIKYKCTNCGKNETAHLKGMMSFFG